MVESVIGMSYKQSEKEYNDNEQFSAQELFNKRIWRVGDVAKFLGCTVGHVYNLASDEKIPKRKNMASCFLFLMKSLVGF